MNTELTFTYAGYEYCMVREGNQYVVYYWQDGKLRSKTRLCANMWLNGNQRPVKDAGTLEEFETRVRELQRLTTPRGPRPPMAQLPTHRTPAGKRPAFKTKREPKGRAE